jgi:NTE family protein
MSMETRKPADLPAPAGGAPRYALVLSGGGARGAYEAGILGWILDDLPPRLGRPVRFDILTGTSVGAIHACFLAGTAGSPGAGARLTDLWHGLDLARVFRVRLGQLLAIPFRSLGIVGPRRRRPESGIPERLAGLLDSLPLERLVRDVVPWAALRRNVDAGVVEAVAVTATEIATGRSIVWIDNRERRVVRWARDPFIVARPAALGPAHALASAAIPLLFPAPRVDGGYYCDGSLRLNTPLAPALRLGGNRLLIVGLTHADGARNAASAPEEGYGSLFYLGGKVLNALLLDHVDYDVDRLRIVNAILDTGVRAYGPDFLARMNATVEAERGTAYQVVRNVYLRPSQDIAAIAADCLAHRPPATGWRGRLADLVLRHAMRGGDADLLSYLYFDRCYADHLIALGRADAEAQADALLDFFSA